MPICTIQLVKLSSEKVAVGSRKGERIRRFLEELYRNEEGIFKQLVIASEVNEPIIRAEKVDGSVLNGTEWDLFLLFSPELVASNQVERFSEKVYQLKVGIPSKILQGYRSRSEVLRKEAREGKPLFSGVDLEDDRWGKGEWLGDDRVSSNPNDSTQKLQISPRLVRFGKGLISKGPPYDGPVSMLNLMSFNPGQQAKESYHKYGREFVKVAGKRGGEAKLVGVVVPPQQQQQPSTDQHQAHLGWDELSFVHYPSIKHFIDMSADEEYQRINRVYRLGALKDTTLICTTEIDLSVFSPNRVSSSRL